LIQAGSIENGVGGGPPKGCQLKFGNSATIQTSIYFCRIWHHAAVYLGAEGKVCEADLDGVRYGSLDRYSTGQHYIRVRRAPGLSDNQRWQIAVKSLVELNQRYSFEHLWELLRLSRFRLGRSPTTRVKLPRSAKICSQLYEDAFCKVTSETLSNPDDGEITPACLSRTEKLNDVQTQWLVIG
jgi:hypothetical protein